MQDISKKNLDIKLNCFLHLRQYPNKTLVSKSKIITFKNNSLHFQQRCILFTELCYMLIKMQVEESSIYLSKNIFINQNQLLYMFFTTDSTHQNKFKTIQPGNLLMHILQLYEIVFEQNEEEIKDYQKRNIFLKTKSMISILEEKFHMSQPQYYQTQQKNHNLIEQISHKNNSQIMTLLENSQIFQEYSYFLKFNNVFLIKSFLHKQKQEQKQLNKQLDLEQLYLQYTYIQSNIFQMIYDSFEKNQLQNTIQEFQRLLGIIFKCFQEENQLTLIKHQIKSNSSDKQQSKDNKIVCKTEFTAILRKIQRKDETPNQKSEQNLEIHNYPSSLTNQEEKNKYKQQQKKQAQVIKKLKDSKSKVNFKITSTFYTDKPYFIVQIEGKSQWTLDEYYYSIFSMVWNQFLNNWNDITENNQDIGVEQRRSYKLQLFQTNKQIGIRQWFKVDRTMNALQQLISTIDQINAIFIIFEQVLNNLYKINQNYTQNDNDYLKIITKKTYVQNLIRLMRYFQKQYAKFYEQLTFKKNRIRQR